MRAVVTTRDRLLHLVRKTPGASVSELARAAGVHWASAAVQIERLRAEGRVETVRIGRRRVVFPVDRARDDQARLAILGEPACLRVARGIVEHPDLRVWELSDAIQMSERAVYHHVKRLVAARLVESTRPGAYRGLRATSELLRALEREDP